MLFEQLGELGDGDRGFVQFGDEPVEGCVGEHRVPVLFDDVAGVGGHGVEHERGDGPVFQVGRLADGGVLFGGHPYFETVTSRTAQGCITHGIQFTVSGRCPDTPGLGNGRPYSVLMASQPQTGNLKVGDRAPAFTLTDQHGKAVSLTDLKGRKVLVYFYPKADTPGCTTQACALRDILGDVGGTAVLGISPDAPKSQAAFDKKYSLGFPLLADEDHSVAESYGVWVERSMYGRKFMGIERSAFLVGPDGKLQQVWYKVAPAATASNLLSALSTA